MNWLILGTFLLIIISVILVLIVLAQRPQGGGLASAFGGAGGGGSDTAFGGRTGDVLTYATIAAFVCYVLVAVMLNIFDNRLMESGVEAISTAEQTPGATVPLEALETVPVTATPGAGPVPADAVTAPVVAPIGSTENDLPGQE
ncbi:MAG: preprotein translocase subunit SecG [Planctomycetota bacterium]|nr:preprotein translocase subunit SecG [Planctomycetota bacterium]MEC8559946.1 preprotein translocase subunit SecG [Planctomycetota bacterium]MEC8735095.1 preprotein translocase subunit SecG [Planctomycetota bacterium]MEC8818219.1 preprotein translocase subunit SecG [Planctomycetota bacterium]MEC9157981.1 preprotein translocase subunit SecG [Planctomycetota bacterium]